MEATCSSETSVDLQQTTWCYTPEDRMPHDNRCENIKSYILQWVDSVLGNNLETNNKTTAAARQQIINKQVYTVVTG
jgi:hypothetical protein